MPDDYTTTAAALFGIPEDQVTSEQRRDAKALSFHSIYGGDRKSTRLNSSH